MRTKMKAMLILVMVLAGGDDALEEGLWVIGILKSLPKKVRNLCQVAHSAPTTAATILLVANPSCRRRSTSADVSPGGCSIESLV